MNMAQALNTVAQRERYTQERDNRIILFACNGMTHAEIAKQEKMHPAAVAKVLRECGR